MKSLYMLVFCSALLAACSSSKADSGSAEQHAHKPTMNVTWKVSGNQITVKVDTDLHISPEHYGQARADGEGHIHMYLDHGEKVGVKEEEKTFPNLEPGKHNLKVSLHNNDHTPYDVTEIIDFEIK
ncbi:hypothetical protein SD71_00750 [Cohnella kolymensis]|uniref:YtkA-like domain-containing protein n=1 Tax=Cohnella kolymensis TaxID=1590652 RepID=A0ABR5A897_9BACL|nr:hypothetical protein [Cohnella kolymensis]KIL37275.1 hypothetical protein SD71_00750 [Cohnella kolymensis]